MTENAAPAVGAGEGGGAPAGQSNEGNPAGGDVNNQEGAGAGGAEGGAGESQNDNQGGAAGDVPTDPRDIRNRMMTLSEAARQAQEAAEKADRAAAEAERRAEYYRGLAEGKGGQNGAQPRAERVDPNPKPDPGDKARYPLGADDPMYIKDLAKYEIRAEQQAAAADEARKLAAQAEFTERRKNYLSAVEQAQSNPDTPNAAKQLGLMAPAITDLVAVSPHASLIAEHLHNKPDDYKALVSHVSEDGRLSPRGLAEVSRRLGVFEATLPGQFAARKVTKAPPPAEGVGGGGAARSTDVSRIAASGDSESYRRWREANPNG